MNTIKIPNTNNKLACPVFAHICPAPPQSVYESQLKQLRDIEPTGCDLPPFKAQIVTMLRFKLDQLFSVITLHSDGVDAWTFMKKYLIDHPEATADTEMAAYFFRRSDESEFPPSTF